MKEVKMKDKASSGVSEQKVFEQTVHVPEAECKNVGLALAQSGKQGSTSKMVISDMYDSCTNLGSQ